MPLRPAEFLRRGRWRGFAALGLLALVPKCLLCLAAWLGLGAVLGLGGPELCGAAPAGAAEGHLVAVVCLVAMLLLAGLGWLMTWRQRRSRSRGGLLEGPAQPGPHGAGNG